MSVVLLRHCTAAGVQQRGERSSGGTVLCQLLVRRGTKCTQTTMSYVRDRSALVMDALCAARDKESNECRRRVGVQREGGESGWLAELVGFFGLHGK